MLSFGAAEGLARCVNWGLMVILPLALGSAEEYGRIGIIVSIEVLLSSVSLMGLDRAILRFYPKDDSPGDLLSSVLAIWAAMAWLPFAGTVLLYFAGFETLFGAPVAPHLMLLSVIVAVFNLNQLCVSISRLENDPSKFLRFRICFVTLKIVFVLLFARLLGNSFAYIAGFGLAMSAMLLFIVPLLRSTSTGTANEPRMRMLFLFGWPFVLHIASGNVLTYFSRFFLEAYSTIRDVGVFTFAFTLGAGINLVYASLATYFEPRIYSHAEDNIRCEQWLGYYANLCVAVGAAGGAALLLVYPYLAHFLAKDFEGAFPILSMVLGTILLRPIYLQSNFRLVAHQATHYIASGSFIGAVASVLLNLWMIPSYGIWGAAVALYIANFIFCAYTEIISLRIARVPLRKCTVLATDGICTIGSLSALIWANNYVFAVLTLVLVSLSAAALLVRSIPARGEQTSG